MRKILLGDGHQSQILPERALWQHISARDRAGIRDVHLKLPKNAGNLTLRQRPFADRSRSVQLADRARSQAADAAEYSDWPTSKPAPDRGHASETTFYVDSSASAGSARQSKQETRTSRNLDNHTSSRTKDLIQNANKKLLASSRHLYSRAASVSSKPVFSKYGEQPKAKLQQYKSYVHYLPPNISQDNFKHVFNQTKGLLDKSKLEWDSKVECERQNISRNGFDLRTEKAKLGHGNESDHAFRIKSKEISKQRSQQQWIGQDNNPQKRYQASSGMGIQKEAASVDPQSQKSQSGVNCPMELHSSWQSTTLTKRNRNDFQKQNGSSKGFNKYKSSVNNVAQKSCGNMWSRVEKRHKLLLRDQKMPQNNPGCSEQESYIGDFEKRSRSQTRGSERRNFDTVGSQGKNSQNPYVSAHDISSSNFYESTQNQTISHYPKNIETAEFQHTSSLFDPEPCEAGVVKGLSEENIRRISPRRKKDRSISSKSKTNVDFIAQNIKHAFECSNPGQSRNGNPYQDVEQVQNSVSTSAFDIIESQSLNSQNQTQVLKNIIKHRKQGQGNSTNSQLTKYEKADSRRCWNDEYYSQIKKANMYSGTKDQSHIPSSSLELKQPINPMILEAAGLRADFEIKKEEEYILHNNYRNKVMNKVHSFLESDKTEYLKDVLKKDTMIIKGSKPHLKCDIYVTKLSNKCDQVSGEIFQSYQQEYVDDFQAKETAEMYEERTLRELGLKTSEQLIPYFVDKLDRIENTKKHEKMKRSLKIKKDHNDGKKQKEQKLSVKYLPWEHLLANMDAYTGHAAAGKPTSRPASQHMPHKHSIDRLDPDDAYAHEFNAVGNQSVQHSDCKWQRTKYLVTARLKKMHQEQQMTMFDTYQQKLEDGRYTLEQEMHIEDERNKYMADPLLAPDLNEVVDANLERMVAESDFFEHVQEGTKLKLQMNEIKARAAEMTSNLVGRAEIQTNQQLKSINRSAIESIKNQFAGNKKQYLINKFIANLKRKVKDTYDKNLAETNETFVASIIKKRDYMTELRKFVPETAQSKKKQASRNTQMQRRGAISTSSKDQRSHDPFNALVNLQKLGAGVIRPALIIRPNQNMFQMYAQKNARKGIDASSDTISSSDDDSETSAKSQRQPENSTKEAGIAEVETNPAEPEMAQPAVSEQPLPETQIKQIARLPVPPQQQNQSEENVIGDFIKMSLGLNQQPLPVLQRITADGFLPLVNYQINDGNLTAFAMSLPKIIPHKLKKLYLVNNSISDQNSSKIVEYIVQAHGLQGFGLIKNSIGEKTYLSLSKYLIPSKAFRSIKSFVLKDPSPEKAHAGSSLQMLNSLSKQTANLQNLSKLCLSKLSINSKGLGYLAKAVTRLKNLHHLDISANRSSSTMLSQFLVDIEGKNHLRSLSIGYNSGRSMKDDMQQKDNGAVPPLKQSLSEFMHHSTSLLHLDISCLGLSWESYKYIALNGLRKSHTLLAVHISGMGLMDSEMIELREVLKVNETRSYHNVEDFRIQLRHQVAKVHQLELDRVFRKVMKDSKVKISDWVARQALQQKQQVQLEIKRPLLENDSSEQIVYQRNLGRKEIYQSHRWVENFAPACHLCQKLTYCFFIWNKKLSLESHMHEDEHIEAPFFYEHSAREPIIVKDYKHPIICVSNHIYQMLPLTEFIERLTSTKAKMRACNNELELEKYQTMEKWINCDFEQADPTYWNLQKDMSEIEGGEEHTDQAKEKSTFSLAGWYQKLNKLLPSKNYQPISLLQYGEMIEKNYDLQSESRSAEIARDTWVCAMYLPESTDSKQLNLVIKDPSTPGVDFLQNLSVPRSKHLSINTLRIAQKQIKKVAEIRHFRKPTSIFAKWMNDTNSVIKKAFETDIELSKISKFVKDELDLKRTYAVLQEHYEQLKNQFVNQIANPKSYPVVDWFDFVAACSSWAIIDKNLTQTDIDRIFIATNFEEEDLEENDDNSLCRFEFAEIIARMAKTKFYEKGACKTVHESCRRLIEEYIVPNSCEVMAWQEFREKELWTLEIDDIMKANLVGIQGLFTRFATNGRSKVKSLTKDDALSLLEEAGKKAMQLGECHGQTAQMNTPPNQTIIVQAYSLSKMTLADEMKEFENYNKMLLVEFYEFLARWAHLLYNDDGESLITKLERLLKLLLAIVGVKFQRPPKDDDVDSDSDYDDDLVDELLEKMHQNGRKKY